MLCSEEVYRQIVEWDVQHPQQAKYGAQLRALFAVRQICAQHEIRNEDQKENQLKRTAGIERVPDAPDRLCPHDRGEKLGRGEDHSHLCCTCRKAVPLEIAGDQECETSDEQ